MQKTTKIKFIFLLLVNILLIGLFVFLHSITIGKISDAAVNEEKIRNEIIRRESIDAVKKDLGDNTDYEKELRTYFIGPDEADLAGFISLLEKFSLDHGLKITVTSVTFEDAAKLSAIKAEFAKLRIIVSGKWENTQDMIRYLESYPLKIEIKSISLQKNSDSKDWSESIEFNVARMKS